MKKFLCVILSLTVIVSCFTMLAFTTKATTVVDRYTAYEYYYDQLNHDEKIIYDGIKTALTGVNPVPVMGLEAVTTKGAVTTQEHLDALLTNCKKDMGPLSQNALDAFVLDHPEFADFAGYMQTQFQGSASGGQGEITIKLVFAEITGYDTQYANIVAEITKIKATGSAQQKVRTIHDYLCNKIVYQGGGSSAHNLYGALLAGKCVCQGYANAFKAACDYYGVPCVCISGMGYTTSGSEAHMWNAVQIDGAWYGVDVTWDDQSTILDDFFLVGSDSVDTHFEKMKFSESHVANGKQTEASTKTFTYPTLSAKTLQETSASPEPIPVTPASDEPQITVSSTRGATGKEVTVDVGVKNNPGFMVLCFAIQYDSEKMTLTNIENKIEGFSLTNEVMIVLDGNENFTADGTILKLTFAIHDDAAPGDVLVYPFAIDATNDDSLPVSLAAGVGTVTIMEYLYGDANGDGIINTLDLALLRKYLASKDPQTGIPSMSAEPGIDANGDGTVSTLDLAMLRKYLANKDPNTGESSVILGPKA